MMSVNVKIRAKLSKTVNNQDVIRCRPGTVSEILDEIGNEYPEFRRSIYNEKRILHRYILILLDRKSINHKKGINTVVKDGQELMIFIPPGGG